MIHDFYVTVVQQVALFNMALVLENFEEPMFIFFYVKNDQVSQTNN